MTARRCIQKKVPLFLDELETLELAAKLACMPTEVFMRKAALSVALSFTKDDD